jgi:hypothetical protein
VTGVGQACDDLAAWLPAAAPLTAIPDTDGTTTRSQPHSRPPWNAIAYAIDDASRSVLAIEQQVRHATTGTTLRRGGSDANVLLAIAAIRRLIEAAPELEREVCVMLERLLTPILQHPAIDLEQPPRRLAAACPRCGRPMLRWHVLRDELACLGCQRRAALCTGPVSGAAMLAWDDGDITLAPEGLDK